ncbi:nucleotide sugar dehydrogenase [Haloarchaeobius sp. FL176]|uniref:nucleotide sugar dehydrogenase n=1 Tax=Haloarchaeobius sp. FL176 TaxID=2967129 RepID=UPI00214903CD|nr:nucleotide sugar dehydrogenase [Haloarchaeobius sp. FL176]
MTDGGEEAICVVGLGFVGLELAVAFDEAGKHVVGYDIDSQTVAALSSGTDPLDEVGDRRVAEGGVHFTDDPTSIGDADYVLITVPTPVDDLGRPDLGAVEEAGRTVGRHLHPGSTVVLESTVYPGVTRTILVPAIEDTGDLTAHDDFDVAYSPERLSPGTRGRDLETVTKIVGARSDAVRDDVADMYEDVVDAGVYRAPDPETAEAAKVIENVQRDINIALINELAMACDHMDLETEEVLEAAGTKWNFHDEYRPGLVGGHCIPVDPLYLTHRSEKSGFSPELIHKGREINEHVPRHVARRTVRSLNESGRVLRESELLLLGTSYKANVGDVTSSETPTVVEELQSYDIGVTVYDPHTDVDTEREMLDVPVADEFDPAGYDGVLVATAHDEFAGIDLASLAEKLNEDPILVDIPGMHDDATAREHGFVYDKL